MWKHPVAVGIWLPPAWSALVLFLWLFAEDPSGTPVAPPLGWLSFYVFHVWWVGLGAASLVFGWFAPKRHWVPALTVLAFTVILLLSELQRDMAVVRAKWWVDELTEVMDVRGTVWFCLWTVLPPFVAGFVAARARRRRDRRGARATSGLGQAP